MRRYTGRSAFALICIFLLEGCATPGSNQGVDRLIGHEWLLLDIDEIPVAGQTDSTINFDDATHVTGHGGCNRFFGAAKLGDDTLELGPLGTTRMACAGNIMEQEHRFLSALEAARLYRLDDESGLLLVSDDQGKPLLRFGQNKTGVSH